MRLAVPEYAGNMARTEMFAPCR